MAKRFTVQDLSQPTFRGPQGRAIDSFVPRNQVRAQRPGVFDALASLTQTFLKGEQVRLNKRVEQADVQSSADGMEQARNNSELVDALNKEFAKRTKGLTDPEKIADARADAVRFLSETTDLPVQVNPRWLIGFDRTLAAAAANQAAEDLTALAPEITASEDPKAAQAALDAAFGDVLADPSIGNSPTARGVIDNFRADFEPSFTQKITAGRLKNQERQDDVRKGVEMAQGFTGLDGTKFSGYLSLNDVEADPEAVASSVSAAIQSMRTEGVTRAGKKFIDNVTSYIQENIEARPDEMKEFMARLGDVEVTPGVKLRDDRRPEAAALRKLRGRVDDSLGELQRKHAQRSQLLNSEAGRIYSSAFAQALEETGGDSLEATRKRADELVAQGGEIDSLLTDTGLSQLPDSISQSFTEISRDAFAGNSRQNDAEDSAKITSYRLLLAKGEPKDVIDRMATGTDGLSSKGLLQWNTLGISQAQTELSKDPGYKRVQEFAGTVNPSASRDSQQSLADAQDTAMGQLQDLARLKVLAGEDASRVTSSPEGKAILEDLKVRAEAINAPIDEAQSEFQRAKRRNNNAEMVDALRKLKPLVDPTVISKLTGEATTLLKNNDDLLVKDLSYQNAVNSMRAMTAALISSEDLKPEDQARIDGLMMGDFISQSRALQSSTFEMPVSERKTALAAGLADIATQVAEKHLTSTQMKSANQFLDKGAPDTLESIRSSILFEQYKASKGESISALLLDKTVFPVVDKPREEVSFFTSTNSESAFASSRRGVFSSGLELALEGRSGDTKPLITNLALIGEFSVDDILSGTATFTSPEGTDVSDVAGGSAAVQAGRAQAIGFTVKAGPRLKTLLFTMEAKLDDLPGQFTLAFKKPGEIDSFTSDFTPAQRKKLYTILKIEHSDLTATDAQFVERQKFLLSRFYND